MSFADFVLASSLCSTGQKWSSLWHSEKFKHLICLYRMVSSEYLRREILEINAPGTLPNVKIGEVCLRFSIQPTPLFGIQHVRAAFLHYYYALRYRGKLIIRFEDTSPIEGSAEFVVNLLKDLKTLGITYDFVSYTSDYFLQMIKMAESLILQGKAYVDNTPPEQIRKEMVHGIESKCRNHSPEENMALWKQMMDGSDVGRKCYLRGKLDMRHPNLRDPVYYLCSPNPHNRTGTKFKVYPTNNFSCPYIDAAQTITHVLRSSYHKKSSPLYYRILKDMGFSRIQIYNFKLLNMAYMPPRPHQLEWFVKNEKVDGWDDPRLPTVQGLARRGVMIGALKKFLYEQGTLKNSLIEWDRLWSINIEMLETEDSCVHTAVLVEKRVRLRLTNFLGDEDKNRHMFNYSKEKDVEVTKFSKEIWLEKADACSFSEGDEINLMDWNTAIIEGIEKDKDGNVTALSGYLNGGNPYKSPKNPMLWLPVTDELVDLSLVKFDYLITKKKLEAKEDFLDVLNPCTKKERRALGNPDMRNLKHGEIVLLGMKGYYRCDVPSVDASKPIVLFAIPGGAYRCEF
ncbi:hypothetical protein AQUCO_01400225v1 [Aquilegia coerulea]|uniref:glutamate--tRNA ligase n=1 Tax=Aquilegia coerulea TaxID=218851 RepID=A0A2G5DV73_AQUCA|nr:hypothetical protein AQUCO_01400225v1 [Aquilegia coerulea]